MRLSSFAAPLALFVCSACLDVAEPEAERVGLVTARAYLRQGQPVLRGTATFYSVSGLQLQDATPRPCQLFAYDPNPVGAAVPTLDAGDPLSFGIRGTTVGADQVRVGSFIRYEMGADAFLSFQAGDTLSVQVPGAIGGFEATSIRVRLAEPFTTGPVPRPEASQPLELTWSPPPAPGSVMLVSMRYNTTGEGTQPNVELACIFEDDGTGTVPAVSAAPWVSAADAGKSILFTRVRESTVTFDSKTRTRLRSFFDSPTPTFTATPTVAEADRP